MDQIIKMWCDRNNFEILKIDKKNCLTTIRSQDTKNIYYVNVNNYRIYLAIAMAKFGKELKVFELEATLQCGLPMIWEV